MLSLCVCESTNATVVLDAAAVDWEAAVVEGKTIADSLAHYCDSTAGQAEGQPSQVRLLQERIEADDWGNPVVVHTSWPMTERTLAAAAVVVVGVVMVVPARQSPDLGCSHH